MSPEVQKWLAVLRRDYGIADETAAHLSPVLERMARLRPSDDEWAYLVHALASAQRSAASSERRSRRETRVLVDSFLTELRKMDESLKVLGVFLERLRQRVDSVTPPARVLH